jgi:hypothetical protein
MAVQAGQTHAVNNDGSTTVIDTVLTQEANRLNKEMHRRTVHVTPWIDLIKKSAFPEGMGYTLGTMIYERALPTTAANGSTLGVTWADIAGSHPAASTVTDTNSLDQLIAGSQDTMNVPNKSYIQFARMMKQYSLKRATVESPRIDVEDLRYAAYRNEQLKAIIDAMAESTRYTWEERNRDEYDRVCGNFVLCKSSATTITSGADESKQTFAAAGANASTTKIGDVDVNNDNTCDIDANISSEVMRSVYYKIVRNGGGQDAYGRENARPVLAAVMSSEASHTLLKEPGVRDDYRDSGKVNELLAPLGIERSYQGFYHLIDDLAPRYSFNASTDALERVYPYSASSGIISPNSSYETAEFEAMYILHPKVMECQVPNPVSGSNGLKFDPLQYNGKYTWRNILDEVTNPDGTIGYFRGVLASATKPLRTEFGYAIIFKRNTNTIAEM